VKSFKSLEQLIRGGVTLVYTDQFLVQIDDFEETCKGFTAQVEEKASFDKDHINNNCINSTNLRKGFFKNQMNHFLTILKTNSFFFRNLHIKISLKIFNKIRCIFCRRLKYKYMYFI
jgi:hypothetical protein